MGRHDGGVDRGSGRLRNRDRGHDGDAGGVDHSRKRRRGVDVSGGGRRRRDVGRLVHRRGLGDLLGRDRNVRNLVGGGDRDLRNHGGGLVNLGDLVGGLSGSLDGDRADGGLLGDRDGGVHGALGRAVGHLRGARDHRLGLRGSQGAGTPGVGRLLVLGARVDPVPLASVGVVAVVDDHIVGRVPGVEALLARVLGGTLAEEVKVDVDAEGQVHIQAEEGLGANGHEGQGGGGLHFEIWW